MHGRFEHSTAVLFVCLGNICRSPMAEGAMRAAALRYGFECVVDSAGTADYHKGHPPDPRAIATANAHGVAIGGHLARQVTHQDFYRFSHIIALDKANLEGIKARRPRDATASISLLLDWLEGCEGGSVPDPYYGDEADFAAAWALIARGVDGLARHLAATITAGQSAEAPQPPRSS